MLETASIPLGLGVIVGLVLGLTGAGGTVIALPLLVFALHLSLQEAAPIVLTCVFIASAIGAAQGLTHGQVRYKTAMLIAGFGMLFAPVGIWLAQRSTHMVLVSILVAILLWIAYRMWVLSKHPATDNSENPPPVCAINPATSRLFWTASCTKRLILTGSAAGLLSGLLGLGGGFIIVPSLHKVSNFSSKTITATTLSAVAMVSAFGCISHILHGNIRTDIAPPFIIGTCISMLIAGKLRHYISDRFSHRSFALLCAFSAIEMVLT